MFIDKVYFIASEHPSTSYLFFIGKASSFEEEDGTGTGRSEIRIQLGRGDLGNRLTCRSENDALPANQPLQKSVQVDINCKLHDY